MVDENSPKPYNIASRHKWHVWLLTLPLILLIVAFAWSRISKTGDANAVLRKLTLYAVGPVAISPNGEIIAAGEGHVTAQVRVWDLQTGRILNTIKTDNNAGVGLIAFSPDNGTIATSDWNGGNQLFLWDVKTGNRKGQMIGDQWVTQCLFFSSDGKYLVNSGRNRKATVEIWEVSTRRLLRTLTESPTGNAFAFPMTDNRTMLVVSNNDVRLRDLRSYRLIRSFSLGSGDTKEYLKAAFSSDGKTLALCTRLSQGGAETTELWDVKTGTLRHSWQENAGNKNGPWRGAVQSLAFSPDSELLSSSSKGEPVRLWDVQSGLVRATLKAEAQSLAFSPDGKTLAVGTQREVQLWKVDALLKKGSQ
ncbi:MAG: hypothetical protein KY445_09520 [Armatimonadetes bacterium]|nr:hypothetical protein [Armatimonadota bacterium]